MEHFVYFEGERGLAAAARIFEAASLASCLCSGRTDPFVAVDSDRADELDAACYEGVRVGPLDESDTFADEDASASDVPRDVVAVEGAHASDVHALADDRTSGVDGGVGAVAKYHLSRLGQSDA